MYIAVKFNAFLNFEKTRLDRPKATVNINRTFIQIRVIYNNYCAALCRINIFTYTTSIGFKPKSYLPSSDDAAKNIVHT